MQRELVRDIEFTDDYSERYPIRCLKMKVLLLSVMALAEVDSLGESGGRSELFGIMGRPCPKDLWREASKCRALGTQITMRDIIIVLLTRLGRSSKELPNQSQSLPGTGCFVHFLFTREARGKKRTNTVRHQGVN